MLTFSTFGYSCLCFLSLQPIDLIAHWLLRSETLRRVVIYPVVMGEPSIEQCHLSNQQRVSTCGYQYSALRKLCRESGWGQGRLPDGNASRPTSCLKNGSCSNKVLYSNSNTWIFCFSFILLLIKIFKFYNAIFCT